MYTLKLIESIVSLSWMVLALVITIFCLSFYNNTNAFPDPMEEIGGGLMSEVERIPDEDRLAMQTGKVLFKNNCATCHNKNMQDNLTGPALGGVEKRWGEFPKEDLYNWIRNSLKLVEEGHPRATRVYNGWEKSRMTAFPNLTDLDIAAILMYIER